MLAAAAVAPYVDEVIVLDKDTMLNGSGSEEDLRQGTSATDLAERARKRKGVPQYIQPHVLLCRGSQVAEMLLPGWQALAKQMGARATITGRFKTSYKGRWTHHVENIPSLNTLAGSRALLEESIRAHLLALRPNVRICCGCRAAAPIWSADGSCMEGVVTKDGQEFRAELVIDAAGRRSPVPGWLAAGGYQPPKEVEVDPHVTYVSRLYKQTPQVAQDESWDAIYIRPHAPNTRGGLVQKIENGLLVMYCMTYLVTNDWCCIWGYSGDHPPHDEQGFQDFVASLEKPDVHQVVRDAEPVTSPVAYAGMTNLRRLYEDIAMPAGLAVIGDSLAGFNPVYGQGITVAAMEAEALHKLLQERAELAGSGRISAEQLASLAPTYQAMAKDIVDFPFSVSTGEDFNFEGTTGERPKKGPIQQLMASYMEALLDLAAVDMAVYKPLQQVMNLMDTPDSLLRPGLIAKVLSMHIMAALPWSSHASTHAASSPST
ncbi:Putative epoxidase LasC [Coccomyxa sp. Obi]|nr:Putative epoxidase LasC [Coccomyxa sp. Obi]